MRAEKNDLFFRFITLKDLVVFILGICTSLGFLYSKLYFLSLLSYFLFLNNIVSKNNCRNTRQFFIFYFSFFLIGCHWLIHPLRDFGGLPSLLSNLVIGLFCVYLSSIMVLGIFLFNRFFKNAQYETFILAAIITLCEFVRTQALGGFPFLMMGYLTINTVLDGYIPIIGVYGMTFLMTYLFLKIKDLNRNKLQSILLISLFSLTTLILHHIHWTKAKAPLQIGVIQTDTRKDIFINSIDSDVVRYIFMSIKQLPSSHFIIWPEGSFVLNDHLISLGTPNQLLVGGVFGLPKDTNHLPKNLLVTFNSDGEILHVHQKYYLAQFNETIPDYFTWLLKILHLPHIGLEKGSGNDVIFNSKYGRIGNLICYELLFPQLSHHVGKEVNAFFVVSDLSWFLDSSFNHQYDLAAKFLARSVEKPITIANNYGASIWIDHHGRKINSLQAQSRDVGSETMLTRKGSTPICYYGDFMIIYILALCILFVNILSRYQLYRK